MSEQALATAINAAINSLIRCGPEPATLASVISALSDALNIAAPTRTMGAGRLLQANDQLLAKVIEARGLPVVSVSAKIKGGTKQHPGTPIGIGMKGTFEQLEPLIRLTHAECQSHIDNAAEHFRNSELQEALAYFERWARSIPLGGTNDKTARDTAREVRQSLKSFSKWSDRFYYATVLNFPNAISAITAEANGALAAIWRSRSWHNESEHDRHNGTIFLIRNSWAIKSGFVRNATAPYTDEMPQPGNDGCRCFYQYIYNLTDLPADFLTLACKEKLEQARKTTESILDDGASLPLKPDNTTGINRLLYSLKKLF